MIVWNGGEEMKYKIAICDEAGKYHELWNAQAQYYTG